MNGNIDSISKVMNTRYTGVLMEQVGRSGYPNLAVNYLSNHMSILGVYSYARTSMCIGYSYTLSPSERSCTFRRLIAIQTSAASRLFASISFSLHITTAISSSSEVLILNTQRATSANAILYNPTSLSCPPGSSLRCRFMTWTTSTAKRDQQYGQASRRTKEG